MAVVYLKDLECYGEFREMQVISDECPQFKIVAAACRLDCQLPATIRAEIAKLDILS